MFFHMGFGDDFVEVTGIGVSENAPADLGIRHLRGGLGHGVPDIEELLHMLVIRALGSSTKPMLPTVRRLADLRHW